MSSSLNTPTILKKIIDRKREEVAERSANVAIAMLKEQIQTASALGVLFGQWKRN
jgi:indole-3-glycerol phosphate synthase